MLVAPAAMAQYSPIQGSCNQGATKVHVAGIPATDYAMGVVPSCTVTVYYTGTTNLATIYSSATGGALSNPFTASNLGQWIFYAGINQAYDVATSSGITLTSVYPTGSSAAGGGPASVNFVGTSPSGVFQASPYTPANKAGDTFTGPVATPSGNVGGITADVKNYGALGNSTNGTDGNDDTTAITSAISAVVASCGGTIYFPAGLYRTTATIWINPTSVCTINNGSDNNMVIRVAGESAVRSGVVINNATQPLFVVMGGAWQVKFENLSLYGLGTGTTGNLVENLSVWTAFDHVTFNGTAGACLYQDAERQYMTDVKFLNCRQPWVQGAAGTNESYAKNIEALNLGYTENPFTHSGGYSYDINATAGVNPGSGAVVQNMRAGIVLAGNSVDNEIDGCSIKGAYDVAGMRVIHGENILIKNCYFEGWTASPPAGIGENPSIIRGGFDMTATSTGAITSTTIPTSPTDATPISAWSATLTASQAIWFRNSVGYTSELNASMGDACNGSDCYLGVIVPPDYVSGSSAPSSIGGGILRGNYEQVELYGVVASTLYIRSRGYNGTTQYAWPTGAVYIESDGQTKLPSDNLHLVDNHYQGYNLKAGFSITANPNCGEPNGVEIELGWMPDCYGFFTNSNPSNVGLEFSGNNRFRSQKMEIHDIGSVQVDGTAAGATGWSSTAITFDLPPSDLGMGGLQPVTVTYSDSSQSRSVGCIENGGCWDSSYYTGVGPSAAVGLRTYNWTSTSNTPAVIVQFKGQSYNLCDSFGASNAPTYCQVIDSSGVLKQYSVSGSTYTYQGEYLSAVATNRFMNPCQGAVTLDNSLNQFCAVTGNITSITLPSGPSNPGAIAHIYLGIDNANGYTVTMPSVPSSSLPASTTQAHNFMLVFTWNPSFSQWNVGPFPFVGADQDVSCNGTINVPDDTLTYHILQTGNCTISLPTTYSNPIHLDYHTDGTHTSTLTTSNVHGLTCSFPTNNTYLAMTFLPVAQNSYWLQTSCSEPELGVPVVAGVSGTQCLHSINGVVSGTGSDCAATPGTASVTATSPLTANGASGVAQTGAVTIACPTCGSSTGGSNVSVNGGATIANPNLANNTGAGEIDFTNPVGGTVNATLHNTTVSVNAQTATLGGANVDVNAGTSTHSVALNEGSSTALGGANVGTAGRVLVDQGAVADPAFEVMSGDCTLAASGAITCTKVNGNTPVILIGKGSITMPTAGGISAGTCEASVTTATVSGADPTGPNDDTLTTTSLAQSVTGYGPGGLFIHTWLTANTVNAVRCNSGSSTSGTVGAYTFNYRVER